MGDLEKVQSLASFKVAQYVRDGLLKPSEAGNFLKAFVIGYVKSGEFKNMNLEEVKKDIEDRIDKAMLMAIRGKVEREEHFGGLGAVAGLVKWTEEDLKNLSPSFSEYLDLFTQETFKDRKSAELLNFYAKGFGPTVVKFLLGFKEKGRAMTLEEAELAYKVLQKENRIVALALSQVKKDLSLKHFLWTVWLANEILDERGGIKSKYVEVLRAHRGDMERAADAVFELARKEVLKGRGLFRSLIQKLRKSKKVRV